MVLFLVFESVQPIFQLFHIPVFPDIRLISTNRIKEHLWLFKPLVKSHVNCVYIMVISYQCITPTFLQRSQNWLILLSNCKYVGSVALRVLSIWQSLFIQKQSNSIRVVIVNCKMERCWFDFIAANLIWIFSLIEQKFETLHWPHPRGNMNNFNMLVERRLILLFVVGIHNFK